jgi:hypothetical protein
MNPNLRRRRIRLPLRPCKRDIGGVSSRRDAYRGMWRTHSGRIEGEPPAPAWTQEVGLENCVKVLRVQTIRIDARIPCRNTDRACHSNTKVREVATDAFSRLEDFTGIRTWSGRSQFIDVRRHGKLPPRRHEELPLLVAEESRNEVATNRGKPVVD